MNKIFRSGMLLAAVLALTPQAFSEVVIDTYNSGAGSETAAIRTVDTAFNTANNTAVSFSVGTMQVAASTLPVANRFARVSYAWGGGDEPFLGLDRFLAFDVVSAVGDWVVTMTYDGLGGTGADGVVVGTINNLDSGIVSFDLATGGNTGHLNGLQNLQLQFESTTAGSLGNRVLTLNSLAAVPEPSSIALLGLTGLGGVVVARRRKRVQEIV